MSRANLLTLFYQRLSADMPEAENRARPKASHADQGVGEVWTKEFIKETFVAAESLTDKQRVDRIQFGREMGGN